MSLNRVVGVVVVYRTGMLAVTGSEHNNSYLQLVYRVVDVVVVHRTGMLAVRRGSKHGNYFYLFFT